MTNETKTLRDWWNKPTLQAAKYMILPQGTDWDERTTWVLPQILTPTVQSRLRPGADALEIGCGIGRLMKALKPSFSTVTGLDISPNMVQYAEENLKGEPGLSVFLCDGQTFPLAGDSIDFVYSVICFQHIPTREMILQYLRESYRVLKPGGMIRVQTHMGEPCNGFDGMHGHFYRSLELFTEEFKSCGFDILEAERRDDIYLWVTGVKA